MMLHPIRAIVSLLRDARGTMVIETAIVAPVLILLSAGTFEVSRIVARQTELQSAAAEAVSIVLASVPKTDTQKDQIETVIEQSTGLADDNVNLDWKYRCGTDDLTDTVCEDDTTQSTYIQITMSDSYTPVWTQFGFGSGLTYNVVRTVQIS